MRHRSLLIVLFVTVLVTVAACSDVDGATTTAAPGTTTTISIAPPQTTTTVPPELLQCSDALADPDGRFVIVPAFDLFACFQVESYRSVASYEGTPVLPAVPESGSASVESDQVLDATGVANYRTVATTAGTEYVTLQFGDSLYLADGTELTDEIPIQVFQSQLAMDKTIKDAITNFGDLARQVENQTLNGVAVTHYQASADDIALAFEERIARELGGDPFELALPATQLDVWADSRGIVLKMEFTFDFAGATADGTPAAEFLVEETPLSMILPTTSGKATYEIYDLGADITIELSGN